MTSKHRLLQTRRHAVSFDLPMLRRTSQGPQLNKLQAIAPQWVIKPKCFPCRRETWAQTMSGKGIGYIRDALHTADSMAWSFAARKEGRNANDWREANAYAQRIAFMPHQTQLFGRAA